MNPPRPRPLRNLLCGLAFLALAGEATADVHVSVVANPDPARPGETLDVELTVSNDGGSARTDVTVVLDYPAGLASISEALIDGDCPSTTCDPGEQVVFFVPVLGAGEGRTFSLPPRIAGSTPDGTLVPFQVQAFDNGNLEDSAVANVVVDSGREVELALSERRDPASPGSELEWTLTYGVLETSTGSPGAMLSMPVPPGTSFVSATGGGILAGGFVEWTLGRVGPGESGEVHAVFALDPALVPGTIFEAEAFYQDVATPVNTGRFATATRVRGETDLELALVAGPDGARVGETMDIELTVGNTGTVNRTGVVLTLEYPDHLASLSEALFDGDCGSSTCDPQERVTFAIGALPAGEAVTFSMPARLAGTANGTVVTLEAEVTDSTGVVRESGTNFAVNSARAIDLALVKSRDPVPPGAQFTYTLAFGVRENSPGAPDSVLRLPLPAGTSFVSASANGMLVGDVVEWDLGPLGPGATGKRTLTVSSDPSLDLGSVLRAEATFVNLTSPVEAIRRQAATRIRTDIPLDLAVVASPGTARPSETLDFEITVANRDGVDRTGVVLTLEYPDQFASLSEALFEGDCGSSTCDPRERVTFDIGTLRAGRGVTFTIPARVTGATLDGSIATLEAEVTDSTGQVLESGATLAVDDTRKLELSVQEDRDPVAPGEMIEYTLTFGTLATGTGLSVGTLRLPLPTDTSFISASDGGAVIDGVVEWDLGELSPGVSGERSVLLAVDSGAVLGSVLEVEASYFGDFPDGVVRYGAATRVEAPMPLELAVIAGPRPARPSELLDVELTVANTGTVDRAGVVLTLEYPDEAASLSEVHFDGDCGSTTCDPQERAVFTIGTLKAGEGVTFSLPPRIAGSTVAGSVLRWEANVSDSAGNVRESGVAMGVSPLRELQLSMVEARDPVLPGTILAYDLTYAAQEPGDGAPQARLSFEIPTGTLFASASNGGVLVGPRVEWPLGSLPTGDGGARRVYVWVPPSLAPGSLIVADALLEDANGEEVRYSASSRLQTSSPLELQVHASPTLVDPGQAFDVQLVVTNTTGLDRTGLTLLLEFPEGLTSLNDALFPGDCPSTTCEAPERALFDIPLLGAGESIVFDVPPQVAGATPEGTLIQFDAFVRDSGDAHAADASTVLVGDDYDPPAGGALWPNSRILP